MRRSIIQAVIASAFVVPGLCHGNDLLDAYHQALEQDTTVRAAKFQRDASIEARPQALAAFLPQLNAQGDLARTRSTIKSTSQRVVTTPGEAAAGVTNQFTYYNTADSYQINLTQTIWSFESFRLLQEANATVAQAEATYRSAQQALILRVAQAYFNVLSAVDTVRSNRAQKEANNGQLLQAKKRFEVGLAAITDVQTAQAGYDTSVAALIASERTLSNAQRALGQITGRTVVAEQTLQEEIPLPGPVPASPDEWVSTALKDNYDVHVAEFQNLAADKALSAAKAKYFPTLGIQGSYSGNYNSSSFNSDSENGSIGLVLNVPIYTGGTTQSLVRQAAATLDQTRANTEGTLRSIDTQTRDAYNGVVSGISSVQANLQSVKSNQTALESTKVGLQVGTNTEIDVLNTLKNVFTAQVTYYQARYDYLISVLTLKQLAGRLTEADLATIDTLLTTTTEVAPVPSNSTPTPTPIPTPTPTPK